MANWKKLGTGLGVIVVLGAVAAGGWAYAKLNTSRSGVADDTTTLAEYKATDAAAVKRGEYVMRLGDCAACHTAGQGDFAGGYKIATPFGTLVSSNITPDAGTGIGDMTERDFFNAVRQGIGKHGLLYPAMPYTAYVNFSDADMHDLWAYMSTIKPVKNEIDENGGMSFPFNIRLAMAGWDMLFFHNKGMASDGGQSAEWNRGKYIVDGGAHCSTCHTPRNILSGEIGSRYLQGASLGDWYAPDITQNKQVGIGNMSKEAIADYLTTGSDGVSVAAGPMGEAVEHSFQYLTRDDAMAVATYLKSLPASDTKLAAPQTLDKSAMSAAALDYEVSCSACHGVNGEGIKGMVPAFAGNTGMLADPTGMIHAMMDGARAPHTQVAQTAAGMPSFAWKYDDSQVAGILTYVRNSWGNAAPAVAADQVAAMRKAKDARAPLVNPAQN